MLRSRARRPMPVAGWAFLIGAALIPFASRGASAQQTQQQPQQQTQQQPTRQQQTQPRPDDNKYIFGTENRLEIVVHVLGEVERPGEYRVTDDTDVLELISKAGGPTRFANMAGISLRRREPADSFLKAGDERLVDINLSEYLKNNNESAPPLLYPGDVVSVPRNKMAKWSSAFVLVRDIAVVVSTYLIYLNIVED